jgi:uncharacterized protein
MGSHNKGRLRTALVSAISLLVIACVSAPPAASTPGRHPVTASSSAAAPAASDSRLVPLAIDAMRQREYPGSDLVIEEMLTSGGNYRRYVASYQSDGLKIFALLTVPNGPRPATGWPVIIFNHGYIPPTVYRTTERYVAYIDAFARNGYIVLKPDYRGFGTSQGTPISAYGAPDDTVDVLNAVTTIQRYVEADPNRIGMWGHSMGGNITLRALVIDPRIKVAVIWAGVNATYKDLLENWHPTGGDRPPPSFSGGWPGKFINQFGTPEQNPAFWDATSPMAYLADITAPIQLHHGTSDTEVPLQFSETLANDLRAANKAVELYTYAGADHNIAQGFALAMARSVAFFERYLKT